MGKGKVDQRPDYSDCIRELGENWSFCDFYRLALNRQAWRAKAVQVMSFPSNDADGAFNRSCEC